MPAVTDIYANQRDTAPDPLLERLRAVTIGEYEIRGELGRGGMAVVYLGKDIRLERNVAIKVMLPELLRTDGMAERFLLEARISARLQHPNIITVHDVRQREEIIFFVMSLVDGCGLDEVTRAGTMLSFDDVRWVLTQAAQALAYANGEGIVHRDVKPGNILLTVKGDVIVTDFGIAKVIANNSLSMGATIIGTPLYMSPEQVTGQRVSEASDQYSLGIAAYALLTGSPPFSGELSLYDLQTAHVRTRPVPVLTRRPDCPPGLAFAVMRMLEKRPADRWPSLQELVPVLTDGLPHDSREIRQRLGAIAANMRDANANRSRVLAIETPATPLAGVLAKPKPAMVVVSPPSATVFAAASLEMSAKAMTSAGDLLENAIVMWSSSDSDVATVTPFGSLLAIGPGTARIRAAIGSVYDDALVTVVLSPIARLESPPESLILLVGDTARPIVRAIDAQGKLRADATCSWLSRNDRVVQVVGVGELRAIAPGEAAIEVAAGTARASLRVIVRPRPAARVRVHAESATIGLGDAIALRADAFDDQGAQLVSPRVSWSSDAPHIVHVDSAGTAIGLSTGRVTITATIDGVHDLLSLTVIEAPIAAIAVRVRPTSVEPGETAQVELIVTDMSGSPRSDEGVSVTSEDETVARILSDGRTLLAVAPGDVQITARAVDAPFDAVITVVPMSVSVRRPAVERVVLSSPSLDLEVGAVVAVTARVQDARRRELTDAIVTWQSLDPSLVTVDARGQLRALAVGNTVVRVSALGADESRATVELPVRVRDVSAALSVPVESVSVQVQNTRMLVGMTQKVSALITDGTGAALTDRAPVWSSSDISVARVDAIGMVEAVAPGRATIVAQLDGLRGETIVQVDHEVGIGSKAQPEVAVPNARPPASRSRLFAFAGLAVVALTVVLSQVFKSSPTDLPTAIAPDGIVIEYQLPQADGLIEGGRLQLNALNRRDRAPSATVRWSVSPSDAATIDAQGVLLALRADTVQVMATAPTDSVAVATIAILAKPEVTPALTKGMLVVSGLPPDGSVRVDGRRVTGARVELDEGRYAIRLQAPGYVAADTVVQLGAGETRTLVFNLQRAQAPAQAPEPAAQGVLLIRVDPWAKVFVDGVLASENGRLQASLTAGRHRLRLENPNFVTLDTFLTIPRADTIKRTFILQPRTP